MNQAVPLSLEELQLAALPFFKRNHDILLLTEHQLRQFLMARNIPIFKRQVPTAAPVAIHEVDEKEQEDEAWHARQQYGPIPAEDDKSIRATHAGKRAAGTALNGLGQDAWAEFPLLRLHSFMKEPQVHFNASIEALQKPDFSSKPMAELKRAVRIPLATRIGRLRSELQTAEHVVIKVGMAYSLMMADDDYSQEDLQTYELFVVQCEAERERCMQRLREELSEFQACLSRRAETDEAMLQNGLADATTVLIWKERQLQLQREYHELELSLQL
jgi:hypothetical protein